MYKIIEHENFKIKPNSNHHDRHEPPLPYPQQQIQYHANQTQSITPAKFISFSI